MSYCKVCSTSRDVTQEQRLDGRHNFYAMSAEDTFKVSSGVVRRAETVKNVSGVTASRKTNLFAMNGRRNEP